MKKKLSITVDNSVLEKLDSFLSDGSFRNKSHIVEQALRKFLEKKEWKQ